MTTASRLLVMEEGIKREEKYTFRKNDSKATHSGWGEKGTRKEAARKGEWWSDEKYAPGTNHTLNNQSSGLYACVSPMHARTKTWDDRMVPGAPKQKVHALAAAREAGRRGLVASDEALSVAGALRREEEQRRREVDDDHISRARRTASSSRRGNRGRREEASKEQERRRAESREREAAAKDQLHRSTSAPSSLFGSKEERQKPLPLLQQPSWWYADGGQRPGHWMASEYQARCAFLQEHWANTWRPGDFSGPNSWVDQRSPGDRL